jgi:hypothetical protein
VHSWLRRLRHDLVKRAVWPARDLRDTGSPPTAVDVRSLRAALHQLVDAEGRNIDALSLWAQLRAEAPEGAPAAHLDAFGAALETAAKAVDSVEADPKRGRPAVEAVLAVEAAFDALARSMNH